MLLCGCIIRPAVQNHPSPEAFPPAAKTISGVRFSVAVVMQRTPLANRWVTERWEPAAVVPAPAAAPSVQRLPDVDGAVQWAFEGHEIELHRSEAEGYYLNLTAPEPRVFVMWRMLEPEARVPGGPEAAPFVVTLSYNEAARMLDGGAQVDSLPLPPEFRDVLAGYVATHYKPEPRRKIRRRDPLADDALPAGPEQEPRR